MPRSSPVAAALLPLLSPAGIDLPQTHAGPLVVTALALATLGALGVVALGLADRWTGRLLARRWAGDQTRDLTLGLRVVAPVVGTALWQGMPAGVGLGMLLSLVAFALRMSRSLVHERYRASVRPSRRNYPAAVEARLRRVGAIDESGAVALQSVLVRAGRRGLRVERAGLAEGSAPALRSVALDLPHWPDADRAILGGHEDQAFIALVADAVRGRPFAGQPFGNHHAADVGDARHE